MAILVPRKYLSKNVSAADFSTVLTAIDDTYVDSAFPDKISGASSSLYIDGGPNLALAFFKFDLSSLSGQTITNAVMRITTTTNTNAASTGINLVKLVENTSWSGDTMTYSNKPAISGTVLGSVQNRTINTSYDIPLDRTIIQSKAGGLISMAIETASTDGSYFYSKEFTNISGRPVIIINYSVIVSPTPTLINSVTPTMVLPNITGTPTPFVTQLVTPTLPLTPTVTPTPFVNDPVVAVAGDIACDKSETPVNLTCYQSVTANQIAQINPNYVFSLGDTQYSSGQYDNFLKYYDPTWGRFKNITKPVVGNHEYGTTGAKGYFDYFNGVGNFSGPAGDRDKGYYSFNINDWHIIALNSECSKVSCAIGSAQETWLRNDLALNPKLCTLAMWHRQYFTSGSTGPNLAAKPLVQALYDNNVDLILGGHNHYYERFLPQDSNYNYDPSKGIVSITIGTGGGDLSGVGTTSFTNNVTRNGKGFGVMKLTLHSSGWDWYYGQVPEFSYIDSGSANCH